MSKKQYKYIFLLIVVAVFALLVFLVPSVGASSLLQVTDTPSPVFETATPSPTVSLWGDCPVGTPVGFGTYTPSPLWSVECSKCFNTPTVTPSPFPTIDPTLYPTEYALTGTPTVLPSSTPSGSSPVSCGYQTMNSGEYSCTQLDTNSVLVYPYAFGSPAGDRKLFDGFITVNGSGPALLSYSGFDLYDTNAHNYYNQTAPWYSEKIVTFAGLDITPSFTSNTYHSDMDFWRVRWDYVPASFEVQLPYDVDIYNLVVTDKASTYHLAGSSFNITITSNYSITPTPEPSIYSGFCSSVAPPVDDTFGFDLFMPNGFPNCDMGWDSFEVGSYVIPAVEICFQPSQIGVITLFGNSYEMGVYALAAAAAALWRFFSNN